jgi:hypothetical protein
MSDLDTGLYAVTHRDAVPLVREVFVPLAQWAALARAKAQQD